MLFDILYVWVKLFEDFDIQISSCSYFNTGISTERAQLIKGIDYKKKFK